jgi:hypothetical protein
MTALGLVDIYQHFTGICSVYIWNKKKMAAVGSSQI